MRAILFSKYGSADDLKLIDKPVPIPGKGEVVLKVKNSSLNAMDWHILRGVTMVKFKCGLFSPKTKYNVLGADVSGEIVEVGSDVEGYAVGDEVFGDIFTGGYAEYAKASVKVITKKPEEVTHEQAAAVPVAGMTALKACKDIAKIEPGEHVLVNGASGGVGSYCVQLAKHYGAKVTAVCSGKNVELVKSLGADEVIDYTKRDFAKENVIYDKILEVAGNKTPKEVKRVLKKDGKCAVIGFTSARHLMRYMLSFSRQIKVVSVEASPDVLNELAELLKVGAMKACITERMSLEEVPNGIRKLSTRRAVGKMVVENER